MAVDGSIVNPLRLSRRGPQNTSVPSGTFLASSSNDDVLPAQSRYLGVGSVLPNSARGGVCVESEQVVETGLGGVHLGEHAPGPRAAPLTLVEQHGLFDSAQV